MDKFIRLTYKVYGLRGSFIDSQIVLERCIDIYLSKVFSKNNQTEIELRDWVFTERLNFESKIQILRLALDKHLPNFKEDNPNYSADLIKVMKLRNTLAHWLLINDEEAINLHEKDGTLSFAKFKTDSKIEYVTQKEFDEVLEIFGNYIPLFQEMIKK
jgi:hypothetical protein